MIRYKSLIVAFLLCFAVAANAQYKVERLLLSGRVALYYEDYVLSIQYFNQAISQKPWQWEPWQLRAVAKFYLEDWQGAEADATKAIELNPYVLSLYDLRGMSRIRQEKFDGAIEDYSSAIRMQPDNQNFWYNRAVCYMEKGEYDTVQIQTDTLIARWSKFAAPYLLKAETFLHQADTVKATEWIDKSLAIDAYNVNALRVRANISLYRGQWKEADEFLSKTIRLSPKDASSYINRALARQRINNLRGAMSDYDMALDINPNNFLGHYNRGLLRQQVGDDNRAIEDFNYVLELEPNNIMALVNRATLLDRTGNLRGAIRDYSRVIEKFPDFITGLARRAQCYRRLGMIAKAEMDEFHILRLQMDKHIGIQHRWSKSKLNAMRKLSDIDPEKYNMNVIDDHVDESREYKSEYRGKVQNRQTNESYMPYIVMTTNSRQLGMTSYSPFDKSVEEYRSKLQKYVTRLNGEASAITLPALGNIGEGTGVSTFDEVERIGQLIDQSTDEADIMRLLLFRAIAYSSAHNFEDARKDLNTVLTANPDNWLALWQDVICRAMMDEFDHSAIPMERQMRKSSILRDFDKILSYDPNNAFIYYCKGTFLARKGDYKEAIEFLTKAIELDPGLPQAYYNRGLAYVQSGDIVKAKNDFSIAGEKGLYSAYSILKSSKLTK